MDKTEEKRRRTYMARKSLALMFALLLMVSAYSTAYAADPSGRWKSSSGNVFTIPASTTDFVIYIHMTNGQRLTGRGRWFDGQIGHRFRYWVDGYPESSWVDCTFERSNPNAMRVHGADGETQTWIRI